MPWYPHSFFHHANVWCEHEVISWPVSAQFLHCAATWLAEWIIPNKVSSECTSLFFFLTHSTVCLPIPVKKTWMTEDGLPCAADCEVASWPSPQHSTPNSVNPLGPPLHNIQLGTQALLPTANLVLYTAFLSWPLGAAENTVCLRNVIFLVWEERKKGW